MYITSHTLQWRFTPYVLIHISGWNLVEVLHSMIGGTMMAAYLRVPMLTFSQSSTRRCRNQRTRCSINAATNTAKIPMPPLNPKDPFLSKLASVAASSPETFLNPPRNSDTPPFLDIFYSPTLMATPAQVIIYSLPLSFTAVSILGLVRFFGYITCYLLLCETFWN